MLPVLRWCLCGLGVLSGCVVWAQATTPPEVDESKIPEWVKRQARSPYKVIIDSNTVKARPAALREDAGTRAALKKPPVKTAAAATPDAGTAAPALTTLAIAPSPANAATAQPVVAPVPVDEAASASTAALTTLSAPSTLPEPPALTLLRRIEPVLSPDLIDNRLNSAQVVVAFTVTASGEVSNLSIASSTDSRLNRAVLRALQAWRYAPIPEPREHRISFAFATE